MHTHALEQESLTLPDR